MSVTVKNGSSVASTDNLTKSNGSWSGTIDNLSIGSSLNFIGNAYNTNKTLIFTGNTQTTLQASGNTVSLYLMPVDDNATNTFPKITKVERPGSMSTSDNATYKVFMEGTSNESFAYAMTSGGGSFHSATSGNFALSGTSGVLQFLYTAPSTEGSVTHTFKVTNSQNNSVEVDLTTSITAQTGNTGTSVQMSTSTAPVITGLNKKRSGNRVYFTASSAPSNNVEYTWAFPGKSFCDVSTFDNATGVCSGSSATSNAVVMTPYADSDNGTLVITINEVGRTEKITASYPLQPNMFPALVDSNAATITKPTLKLTDNGGGSYTVSLLSPTAHQSKGLVGVQQVGLTCTSLTSLTGLNAYQPNKSSFGNKHSIGFTDVSGALTVAGNALNLYSFSCTAPPVFVLGDTVAVTYANTQAITGSANIATIALP